MKITNVKFFKVSGKGPVLAFANIILDNKFIIRGIALVETKKMEDSSQCHQEN